jgi:hypothetical protein
LIVNLDLQHAGEMSSGHTRRDRLENNETDELEIIGVDGIVRPGDGRFGAEKKILEFWRHRARQGMKNAANRCRLAASKLLLVAEQLNSERDRYDMIEPQSEFCQKHH